MRDRVYDFKAHNVGLDRLRATAYTLLAVALLSAAGCKVRVDKSDDGEGGNVKIATPFGSIAVNKDQATASDVGLPAYPGSTLRSDGGGKSARVDMGFGSWKLRVRVANYETADSREQVIAFYRTALNQYGKVIACVGNEPVGTPVRTGEGLTCSDDEDRGKSQHDSSSGDLELKTGSPHHQHIVSVKAGNATETRFTLIALELPHGDNKQEETN